MLQGMGRRRTTIYRKQKFEGISEKNGDVNLGVLIVFPGKVSNLQRKESRCNWLDLSNVQDCLSGFVLFSVLERDFYAQCRACRCFVS